AGVYRSRVVALLCCAQDWADCQCGFSLLGGVLSGPAVGACAALKMLVRYLRGARGAVNWLPKPTEVTDVELAGYGDSDWAGDLGDLLTRRSQSSGKVEVDGVPMHSFSRTFSFFQSLLEFMRFAVAATLLADLSAARGVARREGVGRARGLEARVFWLQQTIKRELIDIGTVRTDDDKADLGAKILGHDLLGKPRALSGIYADMGQVVANNEQ
ncbi:unnamed protein product, partial [Prorocentrum cordatum]